MHEPSVAAESVSGLTALLEDVARRLGYTEGHASLVFEFQDGRLSRFKGQRINGKGWLEREYEQEGKG